MAPGPHMGYFTINQQPYSMHDPMGMRYGLPGLYDPRMQLSGGRHKKVRGRVAETRARSSCCLGESSVAVCEQTRLPGAVVMWSSKTVTVTTTQRRWSGVCQVMSFALSLGVADGGARLLIGDQASDQDWVFNVPKTTDKGASQQSSWKPLFANRKTCRRQLLALGASCFLLPALWAVRQRLGC